MIGFALFKADAFGPIKRSSRSFSGPAADDKWRQLASHVLQLNLYHFPTYCHPTSSASWQCNLLSPSTLPCGFCFYIGPKCIAPKHSLASVTHCNASLSNCSTFVCKTYVIAFRFFQGRTQWVMPKHLIRHILRPLFPVYRYTLPLEPSLPLSPQLSKPAV